MPAHAPFECRLFFSSSVAYLRGFHNSIVAGTLFGMLAAAVGGNQGGGFIVALRAFRLARILRLVQVTPPCIVPPPVV